MKICYIISLLLRVTIAVLAEGAKAVRAHSFNVTLVNPLTIATESRAEGVHAGDKGVFT